MTSISLDAGKSLNISTIYSGEKKLSAPFDPELVFNHVVDRRYDDPISLVYSIDAPKILTALLEDRLDDLHRITLAGRRASDGTGIWDTLINNVHHRALSACVFTATADFQPIPPNRILVTSPFLNYWLPASRTHFNQVTEGDQLGIGINDIRRGVTYVLLYQIDSFCSVPVQTQKEDDPTFFPSVNIELNHILRFDLEGKASVHYLDEDKEYPEEQANPFAGWIVDAIYNINEAFAWKPHYTPYVMGSLNRVQIEERLAGQLSKAEDISYTKFEQLCRLEYRQAKTSYEAIRKQREEEEKRKPRESRKKPKVNPILPLIEVVSKDGFVYASFDKSEAKTYRFDPNELGNRILTEKYLLNKDWQGDAMDVPSVMTLSSEQFGDSAFLRYFRLNF